MQARLESDSESDEAENHDAGMPRKRIKLSNTPVLDSERQIRSRDAFLEDNKEGHSMIHAADVASLKKPSKYRSSSLENLQVAEIILQYPSASLPER